ncbi:MAG: hypothetical protein NT166_32460 [Candidatus Aminicenantes bacterium]|nr:hypothetical protein [Candidatus Aminicenantes bacterium]
MWLVIFHYFLYELRKVFYISKKKVVISKKHVIGFLVFLAVILGFVQYGVMVYKNDLKQEAIFQDFENKKVEQFFNYRIYSTYGFRLIYRAAPVSIFFSNSSTISDLNAFADGGERFNIYKGFYGKKVFEMKKNLVSDYSGVIGVIGGLLVLFYGLGALANGEFLRFLASIANKWKIFWGIYFGGAIALLAVLLLITALVYLLVIINGVVIPFDVYVSAFLGNAFLILLFFFSVGFVCGTVKEKMTGIVIALLIWTAGIFIIPTGVDIITVLKANSITPLTELESAKLKIFLDWQNGLNNKLGVLKLGDLPSEDWKKEMLEYRKNELNILIELEDKMIEQMADNAKFCQLISILFPTSYYQSVNNEISSRGYNELVKFCRYSKKQKIDFILMIIDKEYFTGYSKVEVFSKDDSNIYKAQPGLPSYFLLGLIMTLLYISVCLRIAFRRFEKILFDLPQEDLEKYDCRPKNIKLESSTTIKSYQAHGSLWRLMLYNLLSNEPCRGNEQWPSLKVTLNGMELNTASQRQDFIYPCHADHIPAGITAGNFVRLVMDLLKVDKIKREEISVAFSLESFAAKKIHQLTGDEKGQLLLSLLEMKPFAIYLIGDIVKDMPFDFGSRLDNKMFQLYSDDEHLVLHLFPEITYIMPCSNRIPGIKLEPFHESNQWLNVTDTLTRGLKINRENQEQDDS